MNTNIILEGKITPKDVRVFIEDGVPYLDYVGIANSTKGKIKIHIPKISLNIETISRLEEQEYVYDTFNVPISSVRTRLEIIAENNDWCQFEVIERDMTKKEIEKELGYKVNII